MRTAPARGGATPPIVWLHGVPTSGDDWEPFLARAGGYAPDLPGFGRSSKRGDGDFTMTGLGRFTGAFADALGLDRVRLVVHDWGGAALQWAIANPSRVEKLVVMDAVPLLEGYRWHRWARIWRTPGLGELAMGFSAKGVLRRALPEGIGAPAAAHWDEGTQRAVLRLYRSAPPDALAAAGRDLAKLRDVPSLVVWGADDPYLGTEFAERYAEVLGARLVVRDGAGHWPWVDAPDLVEEVAAFLGS